MIIVTVEESVGTVLWPDLAQIKTEGIPVLLRLGKENLYVRDCRKGFFHENDAALGHSGLCMECRECRSPACSFGRV